MKTPKPIVRWSGGKTRLLKHILPLFRPHKTYVEAFAGGLAVLLAKPKSPVEIVNDINGDLVNLYRHAQFHLDALIAEIELTPNSRETLQDLRTQPGLTGLQRAARYFQLNRMSFGGTGTSYAVSVAQGQASRANIIETLKAWNARMDTVSIENLSYDRLMEVYDRPETLWFLDPPYSAGETSLYDLWSPQQMQDFADRVQALQGDWIVTINDSPENRVLFASHEIQAVETRSGTVNVRSDPGRKFGELIIRRRAVKAVRHPRPAAHQRKAA